MKNNLFLLFVFFSTICLAQTKPQSPSQRVLQEKSSGALFENVELFNIININKVRELVPSELKEYTIFSFDKRKQASFKSNAPITMNLSIPNQKSTLSLELVKVQITTDDYQIIAMPSGKTIKTDEKLAHYRGIVKGDPNSVVAISFFDDEISGIISFGEKSTNLVIGKLKNSSNQIIYEDKDISHLNDFACEAIENTEKESTEKELSGNDQEKAAIKSPKIFFDIANDVVKDKGGAQGASNYIQALFNQIAVLYANDNINIRLSGVKAWTSKAPFDGLNNYREYRNKNSFNGDLGHLVTYNFSGGVAWVNGLCGSYKYGVSGIHKSFNNVPTYSWSVEVVAHELGHNLGSPHTQDCKWNNNNTAIDGCVDTVGGCAKPGSPSGGGTIMSYCHLTSTGINFNKGFGPQPTALIRKTIKSKSCVGSINTDNCNWKKLGGTGIDIGAGGGQTFLVGTANNTVFQWKNGSWANIEGGPAKRVDVDGGGNPWIVRRDGKIFRYLNNRWERISGKASDIGISNGSYYHIDDGNRIYKYVGGNKWNALTGAARRIDVDKSGEPWVVGTNDRVYQHKKDGRWLIKGSILASDISITENGDQVWVIEKNSGVPYKYKGNGIWEKFKGVLTNISAQNNGHLWGVNKNTNIYTNSCPSNTTTSNSNEAPTVSALEIDGIKIYPIPAKNVLNIQLSGQNNISNLDIININGKVLQTHHIDTNSDNKTTKSLNVSSLSTGIYFVKMTSEKRMITQKIFIK